MFKENEATGTFRLRHKCDISSNNLKIVFDYSIIISTTNIIIKTVMNSMTWCSCMTYVCPVTSSCIHHYFHNRLFSWYSALNLGSILTLQVLQSISFYKTLSTATVQYRCTAPANTRHWTNVGLVVGWRRRRRANINQTLVQCLVSAGITCPFKLYRSFLATKHTYSTIQIYDHILKTNYLCDNS